MNWDESQHPRDDDGKFAEVAGEAARAAAGLGKNPVVGKNRWAGVPIYSIKDANDELGYYGSIVVAKDNKEVLATKTAEFHADIIESMHPELSEDDYVRMSGEGGSLYTNVDSAGSTIVSTPEDNIKAMNAIYKALDHLVYLGLPKTTKVRIIQRFGPLIDTTAGDL